MIKSVSFQRYRIEKLAHWKINLASLRFGEDDSRSHGGHATVLKGEMRTGYMDTRDLKKRALDKNLNRKAIDDFLGRRRGRSRTMVRDRRFSLIRKQLNFNPTERSGKRDEGSR